jgi:hypothetical protein
MPAMTGANVLVIFTADKSGQEFAVWSLNGNGLIIDLPFVSAETPHADCFAMGTAIPVAD